MSSYVCDDSSLKNKHSLATLLGMPVQMLVGANIKQTKLRRSAKVQPKRQNVEAKVI